MLAVNSQFGHHRADHHRLLAKSRSRVPLLWHRRQIPIYRRARSADYLLIKRRRSGLNVYPQRIGFASGELRGLLVVAGSLPRRQDR